MATLRHIQAKTGVGIWTLRKLHKAGFLKAEDEDAATEKIRLTLSRGNPLSVAQLVELLEEPTLAHDLGRYADRARSQVEALGNVQGEAAPRDIVAYVDDASNAKPEAAAIIAEWLRSAIPAHGRVNHAWIATRLVWNSFTRADDITRVSLALVNARKELPGWSVVEKIDGRRQVFYAKPKKAFDL